MKNKNLTIGFDATTQEGVRVNSIHLTTQTECEVITVDQSPGEATDDYSTHIISAADHLA